MMTKTDKVSLLQRKLQQKSERQKWQQWKLNTCARRFDIPKITEDTNGYFIICYSLPVHLVTMHAYSCT